MNASRRCRLAKTLYGRDISQRPVSALWTQCGEGGPISDLHFFSSWNINIKYRSLVLHQANSLDVLQHEATQYLPFYLPCAPAYQNFVNTCRHSWEGISLCCDAIQGLGIVWILDRSNPTPHYNYSTTILNLYANMIYKWDRLCTQEGFLFA